VSERLATERLIKTRYRIIWTVGDDTICEVMWPREPGYQLIKELIVPILEADLDHVSVMADFDGGTNYNRADMFVDSEGMLKELPINAEATTIYYRATALRGQPRATHSIHGNAILFARRIWF